MSQSEQEVDRYRWIILGVLWITYIVVFLNRLSVGPLAPFFKHDLNITSTQVGLVMSAASFGYMLTMFPVGWLVDRIGAKWPIVLGEMIAGLCMIALFFATSYMYLLSFMFITGMGCGFLLPSTTQSVIAWFPLRERATVMGLKQTAVNIGGITTAATLPAISLALGWRYGFLFLGLLAIAVGTTASFLYREPRESFSGAAGSAMVDNAVPLQEILKNREIWLLALCGFCMTWVEMAIIAHLVLYLTEVLLFGVVAAGGLLALTEVAGAVARPGAGFISDWAFHGDRKHVFMLIAGMASSMSLVIGLWGAYLSWLIYPVLVVMGIGGIAFGGIWLTLISEFGGRRGAGKAVGLGGVIMIAGGVMGPPIFGYIVDATGGSYQWAWLSLALVSGMCVLLLLLVREEKRKI
jgi:ACS family hexuronate transporter-like MFS transporter